MEIKQFESPSDFVRTSVDFIKKSGAQSIGLSGGSTPRPVYEMLGQDREWVDQVTFYQVDERYIGSDDPKSNRRLINESLQPTQFKFFETSLTISEALNIYEVPPQLDLVILGIGPDGHIASLFPGSLALTTNAPVAHTQTDQFDVHNRLTLTFPVLLNAKKILILLKGESKQAVLDELKSGLKPPQEFPAKKLLDHPDVTIHYGNY